MRRLAPLLFLTALAIAPRVAYATDFRETLDDFSVRIDPERFIACTTYPVDQWDKVDCDGLNKQFEANERAKVTGAFELVGASVYRTDDWGFRAEVVRASWTSLPHTPADDLWSIDAIRGVMESAGTEAGGPPNGVEARGVRLGELDLIRTAYEVDTTPPIARVELFVPAEHDLYVVELMGPRDHAADLGVIADRVAQTIHARPARTRSTWFTVGALGGVGVLALGGTIALFVILARSRPSRRSSAVAWPSTRGTTRPPSP